MPNSKQPIFFQSFMGSSPSWYKQAVILVLILNPILLAVTQNPTMTGWVILIEFLGTLALALRCYPLIPGGLIAMEVVFMQLATPYEIFHEVEKNLPVILLLLFMVAGIHFMKDLLSWIFTKIIVGFKSKIKLSLTFAFVGAFLSAWLDALTVTAVMIAVSIAFYNIYTGASIDERAPYPDKSSDEKKKLARKDFENFGGFLRNLLMHGVVGTALGGVATQVGEPQNLIIAKEMHWEFVEFYVQMAHVTLPVLGAGLLVTILVEKFKIAGYGYQLPENVRAILEKNAEKNKQEMNAKKKWFLVVQAIAGIWLIIALALHLAEVGFIGLSVIIFLTAMQGQTDENTIGHAFEEATPFTSLLVVFFVIVTMIESLGLFKPVIELALEMPQDIQAHMFFSFSGLLSAISDNVFVGTIYITETMEAFIHHDFVHEVIGKSGIAFSKLSHEEKTLVLEAFKKAQPEQWEQLKQLAVAINTGTNIPSIATPNGQAAFLFLLTNAIAARIKLSYMRMVVMAIPYFIVITLVALLFLTFDWFPH